MSKQKQQENQFAVCLCSTDAILKHELQLPTVGRAERAVSYTRTCAQSACKLQSDTTKSGDTAEDLDVLLYNHLKLH